MKEIHKKYDSCDVPIGEFCKKHQVVHKDVKEIDIRLSDLKDALEDFEFLRVNEGDEKEYDRIKITLRNTADLLERISNNENKEIKSLRHHVSELQKEQNKTVKICEDYRKSNELRKILRLRQT